MHSKYKTKLLLILLLHPLNGLFSRKIGVSWYQEDKTSLDLNEARDDGVWDAVASAGQYANNLHHDPNIPTPHHSTFTGRMLFLMPNKQCQSTKSK